MISNIEFTSNTFLIISSLLVLAFAGLIFLLRWRLAKNSESHLTEKYKDHKWSSPLEARNKYPEVNVFRFRSSFILLGLLTSLAIMVAAFNWTTYEKEVFIPANALEMDEDIDITPPRSDVPPPPPPPPPPPVIQEVPNELMTEEDDMEFLDQSIEETTEVVADEIPDLPKAEAKAAPPPPPPPPVPEPEVEEIFQVVEEMPRFIGCEDEGDKKLRKSCADKALLDFVYANIEYPDIARENGVSGTVVVRFYVDKDGMVKDISVIKDIGAGCGAESTRIVNLMNEQGAPSWIPGKQRGKAVKVWFNLPIKFVLV